MSSSAAISQVTAALQKLLGDGLTADPVLQNTHVSVVLDDPSQPVSAGANAARVSLWLYQVAPDEFLRNLPVSAVNDNGPKRVRPSPLVLNLYYLITPLLGSADFDQRALGVAMLALQSSPVIMLHNAADDVTEQLRIGLATDQLDDRIRLWEALGQTFRLSVCYVVRSVRLEEDPRPAGPLVSEVVSGLGEAPALVSVGG